MIPKELAEQWARDSGVLGGFEGEPEHLVDFAQCAAAYGAEQREAELMAKTQGVSQQRVDDLEAELEKAQDEINCAEASLEAASCDFDINDQRFNQGFECLGDFVQAVSTAYREQLATARLQGADNHLNIKSKGDLA